MSQIKKNNKISNPNQYATPVCGTVVSITPSQVNLVLDDGRDGHINLFPELGIYGCAWCNTEVGARVGCLELKGHTITPSSTPVLIVNPQFTFQARPEEGMIVAVAEEGVVVSFVKSNAKGFFPFSVFNRGINKEKLSHVKLLNAYIIPVDDKTVYIHKLILPPSQAKKWA